MSDENGVIKGEMECPKCGYESMYMGWQLGYNDCPFFFVQCENRNCNYLQAHSDGEKLFDYADEVESIDVDFKGPPGISIKFETK